MAALEDVRRVALSLPQASQAADRYDFAVPSRAAVGFAWPWDERIEPDSRR
jgi:hypothetical protein